jgi:hypothetical protein
MTTAMITCFVAGLRDELVGLHVFDTPESIQLTAGNDTIERQRLARAGRWSPFLGRMEPVQDNGPYVPLRAIARVHRGVATGSNRYFVLTRERAGALGLLSWCRPAITRAEEIFLANGVVRDGPERRLLLMVPPDVDRHAHPALDAYLRLGERPHNGKPPVAEGYLASHRRPWWYLGPVAVPPIVASYMARQAPAFAHNPDDLMLLNIAHGIYPLQPLNSSQALSLVRQLNDARTSYRGHGRTYHGGLEKFEPSEMQELLICPNEMPANWLMA